MDSDYINRNVADIFSKKFSLEDTLTYKIKFDNLFKSDPWKIEELNELKEDLNRVKGKLNNYNLQKWHNHTRLTNRAGEVIRSLKKLKPELLTQAWCKFYEILSEFCLIPQSAVENDNFNSLHLCEAPGAFVTSLNHFLKLHHPVLKWNWLASSLNPYFEGNEFVYMINDDRFIVHTLEKWCFGADFTGNIKKKENLIHLIHKAELMKPIHLITADGSVDCQTDPAEQEAQVASLQYCETVVALSILEKGGNFVLKIFTIFECQTVCLLYMLRCSFNSVHIIKPVCSKEGNSEVYVVCLDFIGKDHLLPLLDHLISNYDRLTEPKVIFPLCDIPPPFISTIIECTKFFKFRQVSAILRNIRLFECKISKKHRIIIKRIRHSVAKKLIADCNILPILPEQCVVQNYILCKSSLMYFPKNEDYTFSEKVLTPNLNQETVLRGLKSKLEGISSSSWLESDVLWINGFGCEEADFDKVIAIKTGRVIDYVSSSVFCMRTLLEIRTTLENEISLKDVNSYSNFQHYTFGRQMLILPANIML
ncbi:cap methyltransferase 2 isoform X2 [Rhodnius prolixus]|uniref:cap methyltransferase 2 isoform X2 n=1 Tax=Rhodnius prolixus TaxID=13249 RepID=UPI003D18DEE8